MHKMDGITVSKTLTFSDFFVTAAFNCKEEATENDEISGKIRDLVKVWAKKLELLAFPDDGGPQESCKVRPFFLQPLILPLLTG